MELTRREQSLLLYLETRAVDYGGLVDMARVNAEEVDIMGVWADRGYIDFGRVASADIERLKSRASHSPTHWVRLSEEAWQDAARYRRERAERLWQKRTWKTTAELREGS